MLQVLKGDRAEWYLKFDDAVSEECFEENRVKMEVHLRDSFGWSWVQVRELFAETGDFKTEEEQERGDESGQGKETEGEGEAAKEEKKKRRRKGRRRRVKSSGRKSSRPWRYYQIRSKIGQKAMPQERSLWKTT